MIFGVSFYSLEQAEFVVTPEDLEVQTCNLHM